MLVIKGAYPRVGHLKGAPIMKALALNCKHSILLRKFVNYGHKKFYSIGP